MGTVPVILVDAICKCDETALQMRICYLADAASVHVKKWGAHFASLGHEVHLISFKNEKIEGVTVHYLDSGPISARGGNWKMLLQVGRVKRLLKLIQPDILHAHYVTSYGTVGALTGFHPLIISALGSDVLVSPKESLIYNAMVRFSLRRADWVTAMADHMATTLVSLGIPASKIGTVIFGIDPAVFNIQGKKNKTEKWVITSTRMLEPIYNLDLLIQAIKQVENRIPNLVVNIVGEGSQRARLEEMVRDLGLANKIKFHGMLPQPQIAAMLKDTQIFVTTSLSDGNNISLNEAMACGCISLATDIPANRQWISDGVNGFLVPLEDSGVLADRMMYIIDHFKQMENESLKFNTKIIEEKALWPVNMGKVERKYQELLGLK